MLSNHSAFAQMNRLRTELDRVFGSDTAAWGRPAASPPVNVWEDEQAFFVEAELPGMSMEDLEIYVQEGDELSIKGDRKEPELKDGSWRRRERGFGAFSRSFKLSSDVDVDNVSADFVNGVLTIRLPKSESVKPRKIEINVAN